MKLEQSFLNGLCSKKTYLKVFTALEAKLEENLPAKSTQCSESIIKISPFFHCKPVNLGLGLLEYEKMFYKHRAAVV
jgi:hypothetical protein